MSDQDALLDRANDASEKITSCLAELGRSGGATAVEDERSLYGGFVVELDVETAETIAELLAILVRRSSR